MGMTTFKARPLSLFQGSAGAESHSQVFDLGDASEVHVQTKITATTQQLTISYQKSIDGLHWSTATQLLQSSTPAVDVDPITSDIYRYIRFQYVFTTTGTATFEIDVYAKNYS